VLDAAQRRRLWETSLALCADPATTRAAERLTQPTVGGAPLKAIA
jgi:hypothetical protein